MKSQFLSLALLSVFVLSCSKTDKISPTPDNKSTEVAKTDSTSTETTANTEVKTEAPVQQNQVSVAAPTTSAAPSGVGLNPAHGAPGHRCDIPVGQPLNSAPAPAPTTPALGMNPAPTVQQVAPAVPQPASPQATGPKPALNPAHGEPHHNCAIPVGEPLT